MESDRASSVDRLGLAYARAKQLLRELDTFPELKRTLAAARVRWALAQAEELRERLREHDDSSQADAQRRVEEAGRAIRLAEEAFDRARELISCAQERMRFRTIDRFVPPGQE